MPSPVGHSLLGLVVYHATGRSVGFQQWRLATLYLLAANAADFDFIPGFVLGDPNRYHHGASHSIGGAALFAVALSGVLYVLKREPWRRNVMIFFSLYGSHVALDYLSLDTAPPYGEPVFWPVSHEYYTASFAFLPGIQRAGSGGEFVSSLLSLHNVVAVTVELLILAPVVLLMVAWRKRHDLGSTDTTN